MMKSLAPLVIGLSALTWGEGSAKGQEAIGREAGPRHQLRLRNEVVDTRTEPTPDRVEPPSSSGRPRYVIQLEGPVTPVLRARLEVAGVHLEDYLPDYAYVVRLEGTTPQKVRGLPDVCWLGRFRTEWKLDPELGRRCLRPTSRLSSGATEEDTQPEASALLMARRKLAAEGKVHVVISLFPGEDPQTVLTPLGTWGNVVVLAAQAASDHGLIESVVPVDMLESLAALESIQYLEEAPVSTLRNTTTRWVVQSNVSALTPLWDHGLHGEGEIAGLIDAELWEAHCAFDDVVPVGPSHRKIIAYRGTPGAHAHGTHTAGTLVGDQGTWGAADPVDGMAFAARVSFSLYWNVSGTPSLLYPYLAAAHDDGARVHSNSWGDDSTTAYTTWCEQADRFSRDYEDSLVVFAATNLSLLKTPENAKNVLAVGATGQAPNQANKYAGGSGPTADGRRKPEVFAPGAGIVSASSVYVCGTNTMSGTSMAAPAVAGMAVLARQYYVQGYYLSGVPTPSDALTPTGALLKATVTNSAMDITGVAGYPSNAEGWGRLLMDDALYFAGDARKLFIADVRHADGLSTGQFQTYHINVTGTAQPLKITLAFTDVPGTLNAADPVVNDLDLIVTGPFGAGSGGNEYLGNNFANGQSIAGGTPDPRNNVEQVHRLAPGPGIYTIEVRGTAIHQGTQGYALVATGILEPASPPPGDGDSDYDGDVDLVDFAAFQRCFTDADRGPIRATCQPLDLDGDRDVDGGDLAAFEGALTGP